MSGSGCDFLRLETDFPFLEEDLDEEVLEVLEELLGDLRGLLDEDVWPPAKDCCCWYWCPLHSNGGSWLVGSVCWLKLKS